MRIATRILVLFCLVALLAALVEVVALLWTIKLIQIPVPK